MTTRLFNLPIAFTLLTALALPQMVVAANIDSSTITQVVKDVSIMQPGAKAKRAAQVNGTFGVPEIMRTGPDSRAEMIAADQTVTRVGANTLFSFEPQKREINLQKGSILFNSPTGKGGGTIKTAAATASVLGTTLIVSTTRNGGFKVLLLEGTGRVKTAKGRFRNMKAGQMVFALPGGELSGVLTFQLGQQVNASQLVQGYRKPLASIEKIEAAVVKQDREMAKGGLVKTGLLAGDEPTTAFKVDVNARDVLIQEQRGGGDGIANALASDAIIAEPTLEEERVFTLNLELATAGGTENIPLPPEFGVFYAANTTIETASIDLSPYNPGVFVFVSLQDFIVNQGVSLDGGADVELYFIAGNTITQKPGTFISADSSSLNIYVLGQGGTFSGSGAAGSGLVWTDFSLTNTGSVFVFAPSLDTFNTDIISRNGDLTVDTTGDVLLGTSSTQSFSQAAYVIGGAGAVDIAAQGNFVTQGVNIVGNTIDIRADGSMTMNDTVLSNFGDYPGYTEKGGSGSFIASSISLDAGGALSMATSILVADTISLTAASMSFDRVALEGESSVSSVSIDTPGNITFSGVNNSIVSSSTRISGGQIVALSEMDFSPPSSAGAGAVSSVSITAQSMLGITGSSFNVTDVALTAQTIVLNDVSFQAGSRVILDSASGQLAPNPNSNQPVRLGDVNFIQNVRHGNLPAQQAVTGGSIIIR